MVFIFYSFFLDTLLDIVIDGRPDALVHPRVATTLCHHAFVKLVVLILAVRAPLPLRLDTHLDKTAKVECAANVLAGVHGHVVDSESLARGVRVPLCRVLEALYVQRLRVLA